MFRLLVDTCVWLDLAKDYRQLALLDAIEDLVRDGAVELILPRTVVTEYEHNKSRVIEDGGRSLSNALKRARELVDRLGNGAEKLIALEQLEEVDYRLPQLRESAIESVVRIEALFRKSPVVETSEQVLLAAAKRATDRRAPFHRQRNGMSDAVIFETYLDALGARGAGRVRFGFVTHNTKDFSSPSGDNRAPHPDLASCFTRVKSLYFISLAEALKRIEPSVVSDAMIDREWHEEPRRLSEIVEAIDEFTDKVWHERHQGLAAAVESGRIRLVDSGTDVASDESPHPMRRDIWNGALKAARQVEKQYGPEGLGPWSDFEWGMLNGKLSALRWVLGDEWDMLDT